MKKKFNKKWIIVGTILLIILNAISLYIINVNIDNTLAAGKDPALELKAQQNGFFGMIFAAVVITLDIFFIMYLLYLLYKFVAKTLNNSLPQKP
ncbi:hypothetical protein [Kaistella polysaccharea]|uniref:hypothetical protein n=1 Tax=Kaistella polysaccharea TaxID=2878534 RepID=UPI001CF1F42C|nr:hypothetical protein [Kaistella polysaccharea]